MRSLQAFSVVVLLLASSSACAQGLPRVVAPAQERLPERVAAACLIYLEIWQAWVSANSDPQDKAPWKTEQRAIEQASITYWRSTLESLAPERAEREPLLADGRAHLGTLNPNNQLDFNVIVSLMDDCEGRQRKGQAHG